MDSENLAALHDEGKAAADALYNQATELHELTKRLEELTKDTPAWYVTTRARVEARVALEQAEELRRELEELGERLAE